jgi:hypothetical protein
LPKRKNDQSRNVDADTHVMTHSKT